MYFMANKSYQKEYAKLNTEQKEAVDSIEGPVMVIAGPGTGKTQILAMRIANILQKTQTNPSNILCLTFTNSAVQAMKKRLLSIIGPTSYQVHVTTFHAFCNEVISLYPEKFIIANKLNQLTDLEQIFIVKNILERNSYKIIKPFKAPFHYQKSIIASIANLKQENITPDIFEEMAKTELNNFENISDLYHEKGPHRGKMKAKYLTEKTNLEKNLELADAYKQYQNALEKGGKYDFADMILFVLRAFENDPEILAIFQEKYQYILIDEYQDTNSAQNKIISVLGSFYDNPNIFVVGDDEQSIFRFQGASLENILFFKEIYPGTKTVVLTNNYRSTQQILDIGRSIIKNNQNQIFNFLSVSKDLISKVSHSGTVEIGEFSNGNIESFFVAKKVKELIASNRVKPCEIAIIYKEHKDGEEIIDFLSKLNIPYILEVGGNILEDPEVDKIISYLKALNFNLGKIDNQALIEIMHYPFFGISPLDIYKVIVAANKARVNIFDVISNNKVLDKMELEEEGALKEFVKTFLECRNIAHSSNFAHAFEEIINKTGYLNYLLTLGESVYHLNRLQSLFDEVKLTNTKDKSLKISTYLRHLDLLQENEIPIKERSISPNFEGVRLMTAHKSKGLEFEYVFIPHCTDKHWGNKAKKELIKLPRSILKMKPSKDEDNEEERRLFYVALTRTKKHIYLTYANSYGESDNPTLAVPSIFISEIPKTKVSFIETKSYEDKFDERLLLTFSSKKWQPSKALKEFLSNLIHDFVLSPTSLNSYLECPQKFFYDNILRVPKTKDFSQSYGTAVHKALELLFKKFKRDFKVPTKTVFINDFVSALREEIFTSEEEKRAFGQGKDILSKYYDFYIQEWRERGAPLNCEYDFSRHDVHYNDIPITGKIDRIDLIKDLSSNVKIIDYKTSRPKSLNYLLGQTKENDTRFLYQAYFYKLLADTDPLFNWKVREIEFDFISPEKGKFKNLILPIDEKEYRKFKNVVEDTYDKITNLEFHLEEQACKKGTGECPYFKICHSETKNSHRTQ